MKEMVERVARAICKAEYGIEEGWDNQVPAARAAIAAMREPTPAMIEAASSVDINGEYILGDAAAKAAWTLSIDAALKY